MKSKRARKVVVTITALSILIGVIGFARIWIVTEENPDAIMAHAVKAMLDKGDGRNYFTRKVELMRSYRLLDHLSDNHPDYQDPIADITQNHVRTQLFSRKEWLGF